MVIDNRAYLNKKNNKNKISACSKEKKKNIEKKEKEEANLCLPSPFTNLDLKRLLFSLYKIS